MTKQTKRTNSQATGKPRATGKRKSPIAPTRTTKKAQLIDFLSRKNGADVATISEEFGWLPHTTRAALTGLRKAGYEVTSQKPGNGKPSRYRITGEPAMGAA